MEPRDQCCIQKSFPIILILCRINPILVLTPISLRSIPILSSHTCLGLSRGLFSVGLHVTTLKALPAFSSQATCPAHLNLLDLTTLILLGCGTNYVVPRCDSFYAPYSHSFWTQIFASVNLL